MLNDYLWIAAFINLGQTIFNLACLIIFVAPASGGGFSRRRGLPQRDGAGGRPAEAAGGPRADDGGSQCDENTANHNNG